MNDTYLEALLELKQYHEDTSALHRLRKQDVTDALKEELSNGWHMDVGKASSLFCRRLYHSYLEHHHFSEATYCVLESLDVLRH